MNEITSWIAYADRCARFNKAILEQKKQSFDTIATKSDTQLWEESAQYDYLAAFDEHQSEQLAKQDPAQSEEKHS